MPDFLPFDGQLDSAPTAKAKFVPFDGELDSVEPQDLTKPAGAMGRDIKRVAAPPPSSGSVLEGKVLAEPTFDPQEATALERRSYAEANPLLSDPRNAAPSVRQGQGIQADTNLDAGARLNDAPFPVRALSKAVTSGVQGLGGGVRTVGDATGLDSVARFGAAAAKGAGQFEAGVGEAPALQDFGPKSPVPYLRTQAEGAASSLGQAVALGGAVGSKAVIPALSLLTAGQEYNNGREAGLSPAAAIARAAPMGAFEAVGEKFAGFDKVTQALGTLMKSAASTQAKRSASEVLINAGIREVPGEVATYLGQTGVDMLPGIGINQNLTVSQFLDGLRDTVVQSGLMGGAVGAGGLAVRNSAGPAMPSAADMMRDRGFMAPSRPVVQPAAISQATTVDDAIGLATAALDIDPTPVSNNKVTPVLPSAKDKVEATSTLSQKPLSAAERILQLEGASTPAAEATTDIAQPQEATSTPAITTQNDGVEAASQPEIQPAPEPQRTFRELPPDELMALTMDPTSPTNEGAVDEMRRRETEFAYRQREEQKAAEEEALLAEARDQQAAQATATGVAQELDAPTPMQQAFARATERQRLQVQRATAQTARAPAPAPVPEPTPALPPAADIQEPQALPTAAPTSSVGNAPQIFTGRIAGGSDDAGFGASRGSLADGTRRQLLIDPDGGYFWGDRRVARSRDGQDVPVGEHADFTPAGFVTTAEARAAAQATSRDVPAPSAEPAARIPPTENAQQIRDEAAAAERQRKAPGNRARAAAAEANPMRAFLARHGVAMSARRDFVPGNAEQRKAMVQGYGPIFRRTGLPLDQLAQRAVEEGFLVYPDVPKLEDMMSRALNGERVIPQYAQGVAEAEMESRMERQRQLEEDAAEAVADVPDSILFELDDADIPWDAIGSNATQAEAMEALGFTPEEINASTTQPSGPRQDGQGSAQPRQTDAGQAQGSDRSGEAEARDDGLTSPTPVEVIAQQDRAAQVEREAASTRRQEEQRAQADAEAGDFSLTGSDRAADSNPNQDEIPFSRSAQTETAAFREWFGDSKVVDAEGRPLVVYHGSPVSSIEQFDTKAGSWGNNGMYFSPLPSLASAYARKGDGATVYPVYLSLQNPLIIESADAAQQSMMARLRRKFSQKYADARKAEQDAAESVSMFISDADLAKFVAQGYDGIINRRYNEIVAFRPEQIKSATGNRGTFDPANPDIRYNRTTPVGTSISQHRLVEQTARTITQNWANRPEVIVAGSMNDPVIPQRVRDANNQQLENDAQGQPRAFIYGKKIYLIADQLRTDAAIRQAVWHEGIGHLGLRGVFGDALKPVLKEVVLSRRKDVARKSVEYGLNMRIEADRLYAAEEVLAEMAESRPDLSIVRRAIAAIRAWLRANVPGFDNLRVTNDMIARQYLIPARNWIEQGRARDSLPEGQPAFGRGDEGQFARAGDVNGLAFKKWFGSSKAVDAEGNPVVMYHGTRGDFNEFDLGQFGKTDGGWAGRAIYFAPDANEASQYASFISQYGGGTAAPNVMPVYIKAENPLEWELGSPRSSEIQQKRNELGANEFANWIQSQGYDSVHITSRFGENQWAVFKPSQAKSATGNSGAFDESNPDIRYERDPATDTRAFHNFFAGSKVTDNAGNPLVVYHGTDADFTTFDPERAGSNLGADERGFFFTSDPTQASAYAENDGANVMPAYVSLKNPLVVDDAYLEANGYPPFGNGDDALSFWREHRAELNAEIDAGGHDGAMLIDPSRPVDGEPSRMVMALRPNQAKSASGNRGTFNGERDDIRFARGANNLSTTSAQWDAPEENRLDNVIRKSSDKYIDLKRVQEAIKESGQQIEERFDARTAETLYAGRVAYRDQSFMKAEVRPLLQAMALNKVSMNEMADYLHARGAQERNEQIARVNPAMPDGGAGKNTEGTLMTTQAAKDYLSNLSAARLPVLQSLAAKVDAITKGTRDLLVNEGLEKRDVVNAWEKAYKNYVPMFRDEADSGAPHPQGQGFSVKGSSSKRATGSTKEVTNILAHVLMQREAAITRAEKNRIGQSLYGMALSHPNPDFWTTIRPGMQAAQIAQDLIAMGVDPLIAEQGMAGVPTLRSVDAATNTVVDRPNPMYKNLPGAIVLKVNGEDRVLMLNQKNPRALSMALAMKNQNGAQSIDWSVGLLHQLIPQIPAGVNIANATRWFAAVNTQYNPVFGLINGIRDTFGGAINLTSTPLNGKSTQVLWDAYTKAGPGIAKAMLNKGANDPWAQLYTEFQSEGAQTGYRDMFKDANERGKAVEKELKKLESAGKLTPPNAWRAVLGTLDGFNNTIENAVRLSAYKTALDQGISKPSAAKIARELTVDFNRKGEWASNIGPLYAFFNASVQGSARTLETLRGPAGKRIIIGGLTLGVIQSLLLASAGFDEDEISDFTKTRAFIIPMGGKKYMAIPLPLGLHVLPNTGRVLTDMAINASSSRSWKEVRGKAFNAIGEIAGAFSPFGGGNIFTADGALKTVAPSVLDPLVEIGFNKNFAGSPIEREATGERDPRPGFARAKESTLRSPTGQVFTSISKLVNKATLGTDYEAGGLSPTPERIQYIAEAAGGGLLRETEKIINGSIAAANGEKLAANKVPLVGRFYGEVDADQVQKSRYIEAGLKIDRAQAALASAQKAGDAAAMLKIINDNQAALAMGDSQNKVAGDIAKLNKLAITNAGDREKEKQIDEARLAVMRSLNTGIERMEKQNNRPTIADRLKGNRADRDAVAAEAVAQ